MVWAARLFAGIAILFFGYDQGVMGGVTEVNEMRVLMGVASNPQTKRDAAALGGIGASTSLLPASAPALTNPRVFSLQSPSTTSER